MFVLTGDNDGHWYIIPLSQTEEFDLWVSWMESDDDLEGYQGRDFDECRVDGPSDIIFPDWYDGDEATNLGKAMYNRHCQGDVCVAFEGLPDKIQNHWIDAALKEDYFQKNIANVQWKK